MISFGDKITMLVNNGNPYCCNYIKKHYVVVMEGKKLEPITKIKSEGSVGYLTNAAASWFDQQLKNGLKSVGISTGQFAIMMVLFEEDGLTQVAIGERISMPGYATSRNIDILESRNLVKRHPHESSRRSHRIYITPQGTEKEPTLVKIALSIREQLHEVFDENEVKTLRILLLKLVRFSKKR